MPRNIVRARRPLFVALMAFPASCFIFALGTDLAYARTAAMTWTSFSVWLLTIGLIVAAVAVAAGLIEGLVRGVWPTAAQIAGYAAALILSVGNAFVHSRDGWTSVVPDGLALSAIVVVILLVTALPSRATRRGGVPA